MITFEKQTKTNKKRSFLTFVWAWMLESFDVD